MKDNTYQGYKNRSTWLAKLHLDNTSKEVNDEAVRIAIRANTTKQFRNAITSLLIDTPIASEKDFDLKDIDFRELWDSLDGTKNHA